MIPKYFFLTKGVGKHKENLASFELALRDAGIQHCNLVPVSSIIPPGCKLIPKEKGIPMLHAGEITFVVLARNCTDEPHRLIASSIGIAIPSEENHYGYLSEHHSFGQSEEIAGDYSEDLAASMLATTMGVAFEQPLLRCRNFCPRQTNLQSNNLLVSNLKSTSYDNLPRYFHTAGKNGKDDQTIDIRFYPSRC